MRGYQNDCENDFERWIYVLKNMEALNRMPFAAKDSVFAKIAQIADISALSKEERMKYDEGIRKYRDTICVMDYAIESGLKKGFDKGLKEGMEQGHKKGMEQGLKEGMQKGMQQGIAEGRAEATLANALSLKKNGVPVEIIASSLGLSVDEVLKL